MPKVRSKFDASLSTMTKVGEKISFLKRTYQRLEDGILITPGHYIENMLEVFEGYYGMVRAQKVPCDGPIQVEDVFLGVGCERVHHLQVIGGNGHIPFSRKVGHFFHGQRTCIEDE